MKIGILYICTGKYSIFWERFYNSSQKYFLQNMEKHYFVFTDSELIEETQFVHIFNTESKGFPTDSLIRFELFLSIKGKLQDFDYLFFFNSNMNFVAEVNNEILPNTNSCGLVGVLHPGYIDKQSKFFPYERNNKSTAYIPRTQNLNYYMGSLSGGRTAEYLLLSETCAKNIQIDLCNNIVAIYHDESHLNCYFRGLDVLQLSPSYAFPEDSYLPFKPVILILNKMKHGGSYFDKVPEKDYMLRLVLKIKRIYHSLIWKK